MCMPDEYEIVVMYDVMNGGFDTLVQNYRKGTNCQLYFFLFSEFLNDSKLKSKQ